MRQPPRGTKLGVVLRVGVFVALAFAGLNVFGPLLVWLAYFAGGMLATFAAAAVANALVLRIYERGYLADIGLRWTVGSGRNLLVGVAGGVAAAVLVVAPLWIVGVASFERVPQGFGWASPLFVSLVMVFGVVGEEMLYRGYGFQVLVGALGPYATILPISILFALAHAGNPNLTVLALVNTAGWGMLLGASFLRSGDLWLPIGLHFGWNWALPLLGAKVSGLDTLNEVAGYTMRSNAGVLWSGGNYGPEGSILTLLVLPVLALYLWKAPIRPQTPFLLRPPEEV